MELVINIEQVVINLNDSDKKVNGLITEKDVVNFIMNTITKKEKK